MSLNTKEERTEHAGAELLLQTIEAFVVDEDEDEGSNRASGFSNTGITDRVAKFVKDSKSKAMDKMRSEVFSLAEAYGKELNETMYKPDELEVELSLAVSTKGEVCIVGAEGTAMMKVTMKWNVSNWES